MKTASPYRILILCVLTIPLAAAGCASHSLRPGVWEMSVQAQDYENHEAVEVPKREVERLSELAKQVMESVFELRVPLRVDVGVGASWREAH